MMLVEEWVVLIFERLVVGDWLMNWKWEYKMTLFVWLLGNMLME